MTVSINGQVAPGFEPVHAAFVANFAREGPYSEIGASLAVMQGQECVVDLWAGSADRKGTVPWHRDTVVNVWSTTKAIAAFCLAILVERGEIDYDEKVALYWPDFAVAGKSQVTVAHVLSHQAGLPGFVEATSIDDLFDHQLCAARLAAQSPLWQPGTANGYHAVTYGILVDELVRRVDGRDLGAFLAEELAGPLEADFFIGISPDREIEISELIPPDNPVDMSEAELNDAMALALGSPALDPARANCRDWRSAVLPALNGHGSAQAIARIFASILAPDGPISPDTFARMTMVAADRQDLVLGFNPKWAMGLAHNTTGGFGPNPATVGHSGWGGSFGCLDPDNGIAIGYACNHMGPELVGDPRATLLCNAIYRCIAEDVTPIMT